MKMVKMGRRILLISTMIVGFHYQTQAQERNFMCETPIGSNITGFYEYLPEHYYTDPQKKFPLIIFINGNGALGDGTCVPDADPNINLRPLMKVVRNLVGSPPDRSYRNTPEFNNYFNFPNSFTINSETFEFIITSPQFLKEPYTVQGVDVHDAGVEYIGDFIDYLVNNLRVDKNRIYLTGQSSGGLYVLNYAGSNSANAKKVAAVVAASPSGSLTQEQANIISQEGIPVWMVASRVDAQYGSPGASVAFIEDSRDKILNATPTPVILPRVSVYEAPTASHSSAGVWIFNNNSYIDGPLNSYEWMLQYDHSGVLPITGINLSGKTEANSIRIDWTALSEINSKEYDVEVSSDGINFINVRSITSQNNPNGSTYTFYYNTPVKGINYFRIAHYDFDGTLTYSDIISVNFANHSNGKLIVYPNPAKNTVSVNLNNSLAKVSSVKIFDNTGRQVQDFVPRGERKIDINISGLARGYYFGKVITPEGSVNFSFIKE